MDTDIPTTTWYRYCEFIGITVTGKVVETDYVKMGGVEMIPESIEIESIANALPIVRKEIAATKKKKAVERSSIDQRIDYRWIDLRTDENVFSITRKTNPSCAMAIWCLLTPAANTSAMPAISLAPSR